MRPARRIWFISELYYPEETSTGYIVTKIAEATAEASSVGVICAQPTYSRRGRSSPVRERRGGVDILRVWSTRLDKNRIPLRVLNILTISASMFFAALRKLRRRDRVVVLTNPPLLPFLIAAACRLRRASYVLLIHDVYPEVLAAAGVLGSRSLGFRVMARLTAYLYRGAEGILVLGRDQRQLAESKLPPGAAERVCVIPNWADTDIVTVGPRRPNPYLDARGLGNRFVVQVAGNIGRLQGIDNTLSAIKLLRDQPSIHFLFVGDGALKHWLVREIEQSQLGNVTVEERVDRSNSAEMHSGCDVSLISLVSGMRGVSVPSRLQNALASGRPIIAVVEPGSEVALVVEEENVGWVVDPDDPQALARVISEASKDPELLKQMGSRARRVAETRFERPLVVSKYVQYLVGSTGIRDTL